MWQWLCKTKRSLKLQTMNASLCLMNYMEHHQRLPSIEELLPNLHAERLQHKFSLEALGEDVPDGWMYLQALSDPLMFGRPQDIHGMGRMDGCMG